MPDAHIDLAWSAYASEIAWRVSTVRRLRQVAQDQLAIAAGLSRTQVQNIEQNKTFKRGDPGNTTLRTLFLIARALGVSPAVFIPDGVPRSDYEPPDRVGLERELVDEVAKTSLPPTTPTSGRVH